MNYQEIAELIHKEVEQKVGHPITIVKRSTNPRSGTAWTEAFQIRVPRPVSDISLDTYLHELGHFATDHKMSCMRELLATKFSEDTFKRFGIRLTSKLRKIHHYGIAYGLAQAMNRNLKKIPVELKSFRKYIAKVNTYSGILFSGRMKVIGHTYRVDYAKC